MNSFAKVLSAVKHEVERQTDLVRSGGRVSQDTLLYDPGLDRVFSMRSKEEAHDYRYFPEPDLVPIIVSREWLEHIRSELPEMRTVMRGRFEQEYGLSPYDAEILTSSPSIGKYYEQVVAAGADPKKAANWVMGEILRVLNETQSDIAECNIGPDMLAKLIGLVDQGVISGLAAKTVFECMTETGEDPHQIMVQKGLAQISDRGELRVIVGEVLQAFPGEVEKYKSGKKNLLAFFVGQVMQRTRGKANPQEVNAILQEYLS
jgi:aspartyl-tRNA(Asn)/glutamyl-tRNA(Gln) amidotransferase subunit B